MLRSEIYFRYACKWKLNPKISRFAVSVKQNGC